MRPIQPRLRLKSFPPAAFAATLTIAILSSGLFAFSPWRSQSKPHPPLSSISRPDTTATNKMRILSEYGKLPLAFEPNRGQSDPEVKYMARGSGYTLFLTSKEAVLSLTKPATRETRTSSAAVRMELAGAHSPSRILPDELQAGISNYFIGRDP